MRARGSRSNARGDRRLQLLLLLRLFARGPVWRLVTPIEASFVALRGSGEMSERSAALLARTAGIHSRQTAQSAIHRFPNQPHDSIVRPHADDEDALSGSDCQKRESDCQTSDCRGAKGRADGGTGTHHGLRRN